MSPDLHCLAQRRFGYDSSVSRWVNGQAGVGRDKWKDRMTVGGILTMDA